MREQTIIFTKYPHPGKVKTRLIPSVGAAVAAELHRKMTEHTLKTVSALRKSRRIDIIIGFSGEQEETMCDWLGEQCAYYPQADGDLGDRMADCFKTYCGKQFATIIIGTDSPDLSTQILNDAFDALKTHDMVIGPAYDGGYYLIGIKRFIPEIFTDIPWGTHSVLEKTMNIADRMGISCAKLKQLHDVDQPENLFLCEPYF